MLTKYKIKRYLKSKQTWTIFDEVLNFCTTIHFKEVLKFWGLKNIQSHFEFFEETPVLLHLHALQDNHPIQIIFSDKSCTINSSSNESFDIFTKDLNLNELFDAIRDKLQL